MFSGVTKARFARFPQGFQVAELRVGVQRLFCTRGEWDLPPALANMTSQKPKTRFLGTRCTACSPGEGCQKVCKPHIGGAIEADRSYSPLPTGSCVLIDPHSRDAAGQPRVAHGDRCSRRRRCIGCTRIVGAATPAGMDLAYQHLVDIRSCHSRRHSNTFYVGDIVCLILADATYMLGARDDVVRYALNTLAWRPQQDSQLIVPEKAEFIATGTSGKLSVNVLYEEG